MKTELHIAILILVFAALTVTVKAEEAQAPAEKEGKQILFIGNSFTRFNELPTIISRLAATNGLTFEAHREAPNGESLLGHARRAETLAALQSNNWDCIVLQDLSLGPMLHKHNMKLGGTILADKAARAAKAAKTAKPKLYVFCTWAYAKEYKFLRIAGAEPYPQLRDEYKKMYRNMQQLLNEGCAELAETIDAEVVPVGSVWEAVRKKYPDLRLHAKDDYHPNKTGSYLSALVFYKTFFGETPKKAVTELLDQETHDKLIAIVDSQ